MPYLNGELPFSGVTPQSRHNSYRAALAQRTTRGEKKVRMLAYIRAHYPITDPGLVDGLTLPIQSVCSLRNALCREGLIVRVGSATGKYGFHVSLYAPQESASSVTDAA